MFSSRTNWDRRSNRLAKALEEHRGSGNILHDVTTSNPTECGFQYPEKEILQSLSDPRLINYSPDAHGLMSAREAIARYYDERNISVQPGNIFLTASTSESYSLLFKLLCNSGESVLVPSPSYPLFEHLAQVNDVALQHYHLRYNHEWSIDLDALREEITPTSRAIVLVNPHNPTGSFLKKNEFAQIQELARSNNLAIIVDEVFIDYPFSENNNRFGSTACTSDVLTFTLNGISKTIGLPQLKLGWITVSGEQRKRDEALERLEFLCDLFLSVNTPVQLALPALMNAGTLIRNQILSRITSNYDVACKFFDSSSPISNLLVEGGWYAVLKVPRIRTDEEWAIELLQKKNIYIFPGYYFDFDEEGHLVLSLLTERHIFQKALDSLSGQL